MTTAQARRHSFFIQYIECMRGRNVRSGSSKMCFFSLLPFGTTAREFALSSQFLATLWRTRGKKSNVRGKFEHIFQSPAEVEVEQDARMHCKLTMSMN
jgi:hypothetical protein